MQNNDAASDIQASLLATITKAVRAYHAGLEGLTPGEINDLVEILGRLSPAAKEAYDRDLPNLVPFDLWTVGTELRCRDDKRKRYVIKEIRWDRYVLEVLYEEMVPQHFPFDQARTFLTPMPRLVAV